MARLPSAADSQRQIPEAVRKSTPNIMVDIADATPLYREDQRAAATLGNIGADIHRRQMSEQEEDIRRLRQETERLDNLRVEESLNQLRARQLELAHGDSGFAKLEGGAIVNRKTPVIDEYPKLFESSVNEIMGGLTDKQKEKFKVRADGLGLSFKADIMRHVADQSEKYKNEVITGSVATESQNAAVNWFSPSELEKSKLRVQQIIENGLGDKPVQFVRDKIRDAFARINSSVVSSMLASGKIEYAKKYIQSNVSMMDIPDVIKYNGEIAKVETENKIVSVVSGVMEKVPTMVQPNDGDRLLSLIAKTESGNRDFDAQGRLVTSNRGAQGRMQVMPATQKNPGFGVKPAADNSVEEMARVGRDYMGAMIREYNGDVALALAAYNAGPGKVDEAVKKASKEGKHWINYVPDETKNYVRKITNEYMSGENPIKEPTLTDVKKAVADQLKGEDQGLIDAALKRAESEFNDMRSGMNQESENVLLSVMERVDGGSIRSYDDLTPSELMSLGKNRVAARSYIDSGNKRMEDKISGSDVAIEFYYSMLEDPAKLANASVKDILELSEDLGKDRVKSLLDKRNTYRTQPENERAASVDADQFNSWAMKFGYKLSNKEHRDALIFVRERTESAINRLQNEEKRSLTREEKDKVIKSMMVEFPTVKARWKGGMFSGSQTTMEARGYDIRDPRNIIVPDDARKDIVSAYRRNGVTNPSESQIRDGYVDWLMTKEGIR